MKPSASALTRQFFLIALFFICLVGGVFSAYKAGDPIASEVVAQQINSNLKIYLDHVDQEAERVLSILRIGKRIGKRIPISSFNFLLLSDNEIVAWSDYHFIPPAHVLTEEFTIKFLKGNAGEFLLKRWTIEGNRALVAVLPLHKQFKITNEYLTPSWNEQIFKLDNVVLHDPTDNQGQSITYKDQTLFKVLVTAHTRAGYQLSSLAVIFFSINVFLLIALIIRKVQKLSIKYPSIGFLALLVSLIGVRALMIFFEFPSRFTNSPLFDAKNFASSELNPSLGDLLLNSVCAFIACFYLFRNYTRLSFFQRDTSNKTTSLLFSILSVAGILFGILFPFVVIQTIYNNSTITLSISQAIQFDLLRVVALISVLLAWVSSFFFMHVFLRLLMREKNLIMLVVAVVIGCLLFVGVNKLTGQTYIWSFLAGIIYLVSVVSFSLARTLQKFQYATFTYFFIAVICLALNGMFAVRFFIQKSNFEQQFKLATDYLSEQDYFGEYLLHEATERIASDIFIQNRMASPFLGKEAVEQKIRQVSLSGYFNRYHVDVFLYTAAGDPLGIGDTTTFSDLINRYEKESFKTEYNGVYCITTAQGYFLKKYIAFIPIQRNGNTVGHAVIELELKRVIPKNVYPELLVDSRFQQSYGGEQVSYAIIANDKIQYSAGNFNFESLVQSELNNAKLYSTGMITEKYVHAAVRDSNDRIAIVSSPIEPLINWIADFSFQVILGIGLILILLLMQGLFSYSLSKNLYLAARIQLILNLAFFLPLIAVSIITITLTTRSSQEQLNVEYQDKASGFGTAVAEMLAAGSNSNGIESELTKLATLADLDANVFGSDGKLITTTQPLIFENNLLAPYINPSAYKRILNGEKAFVSAEQVGDLNFYVAYSALISQETGEQIGILTIPFFRSAASLERMQITIFSNIISIFTLVFIVLLMISFLVTQWLTAPFKVITETMGRVSLLKANKPLEWQSNDEIGLLAREYNQMLVKLNDSKLELERNQRERAWREIAQQVAHEIKNPLTPMKLTLQQLERSIENDSQQTTKLNRAVATLLSQVNSLDDIASSFSTFAKMPEPVMTEVDIVKLLTETANLHSQEGTILYDFKFEHAMVLADGQLLKRIFSNLILNGFQAKRQGVKPIIGIKLELKGDIYQISISDNGKGIEPDLVEKIFLPHFTTKQSGSGLGLAIAKQGIEQMNGEIRFETSRTGTTFIISIPKKIN